MNISLRRSVSVPLIACAVSIAQADDPVGHWSFDDSEGSSTATDTTGLNDGLIRGDTRFGEPGVTGTSTAAYFDGSGDYIEIPHHDDYLIDEGTVVLWFRPDSMSSRGELFSKDSTHYDTGGHLTIQVNSSGQIKVRIQTTSSDTWLTSGSVVNEGEWNHLAFVFGEDGAILYVNGVEEDSDSYDGGLGTSSGGTGNHEPIVIGGNTWQSGNLVATPVKDYFTGAIDDVAILDERLTPSTIVTLAGVSQSDKTFTNVAGAFGFDVNAGSGANGIMWADFDNDGDQDAIITGSSAKILWNDPAGDTFTDVTLGNMTRQMTAGDFDNDGDIDFWTRNLDLYENVGNGGFYNRNTQGMSTPSNNEAVASADIDADGRLDLIMLSANGNWVGINYLPGEEEAARVMFTPSNDSSLGLHVSGAYGNGDFMSGADVNNDGHQDFFYHFGDGWLFLSDGDGTYTASSSAISVLTGNSDKTGSAWGDYDNDGDMDLWMSRYDSGQPGYLWRNNGDGSFTEVASAAGLTDTGNQRGAAWGDLDNDGDLDLAIAREGQGLRVYSNNGDGTFAIDSGVPTVSGNTGDVCFVDYDNDGDLDISVSRQNADSVILRNDLDNANSLQVRVDSNGSVNGSGNGTRLEVWSADNSSFIARRELGVARGYGGTEPLWAHFGGLNPGTTYSLRVYYPGSTTPRVISVQPATASSTFGARSISQLLTLDGSAADPQRKLVRWREVSPIGED